MIKKVQSYLRKKKLQVVKPFGDERDVNEISFTLCGFTAEIAGALGSEFSEIDQVEVVLGNILDTDCDALVSPANSFGEMSGGLDRAIDLFYDRQAQKIANERIRADFFGELPVGSAIVIDMNSERFPLLIVAPTMRIPGNVSESLNAYLAMRGLLVEVARYNRCNSSKIGSISIPSLCTGVGGMNAVESAKQMRTAFENVALGGWKKVIHPAVAPFASR